jgi:hypothetical protein
MMTSSGQLKVTFASRPRQVCLRSLASSSAPNQSSWWTRPCSLQIQILLFSKPSLSRPTPVVAIVVTHHHPDYYFSANPILDAFPKAKFHAAPYVRAGIDREYDEKVGYWPKAFGREHVPLSPQKPEPYSYSFFILGGDEASLVCLLGPVQGKWLRSHTLLVANAEKHSLQAMQFMLEAPMLGEAQIDILAAAKCASSEELFMRRRIDAGCRVRRDRNTRHPPCVESHSPAPRSTRPDKDHRRPH